MRLMLMVPRGAELRSAVAAVLFAAGSLRRRHHCATDNAAAVANAAQQLARYSAYPCIFSVWLQDILCC